MKILHCPTCHNCLVYSNFITSTKDEYCSKSQEPRNFTEKLGKDAEVYVARGLKFIKLVIMRSHPKQIQCYLSNINKCSQWSREFGIRTKTRTIVNALYLLLCQCLLYV